MPSAWLNRFTLSKKKRIKSAEPLAGESAWKKERIFITELHRGFFRRGNEYSEDAFGMAESFLLQE
jgi:hypothetical protein